MLFRVSCFVFRVSCSIVVLFIIIDNINKAFQFLFSNLELKDTFTTIWNKKNQ